MRIAIINLTGGGISGGYRFYLQSILPRLSSNDAVTAVLCASPSAFKTETWLPEYPKVQYSVCAPFRPLRHHPDPILEKTLDTFGPDIIFVPIERALKYKDVPVVCMIQNMAPLTPHGHYPIRERVKMVGQRFEAWCAVKHARHIIAMSGFVRNFLLKTWHVPEKNISLVYFGAPDLCQEVIRPAQIPADWDGKYFFSAGSLEPYRGIEDALQALKMLKEKGCDAKLVVAGTARKAVAEYEVELKRMAHREGIEDRVVWTGQLSKPEMNWCYVNCGAFIMTSRVEALAVIILEALAHGCVCISADNPPFPEAFGDAAFYYHSKDYLTLAAEMERVIAASADVREKLRRKAFARLDAFSWKDTAGKLVEILKNVLAEN